MNCDKCSVKKKLPESFDFNWISRIKLLLVIIHIKNFHLYFTVGYIEIKKLLSESFIQVKIDKLMITWML